MTARDGRVSKPPSRQRLSRAKKKGLARGGGGERETKRVTSNGAARSTASFYRARRILLALVVALFPFQRAVVKTNSGKLYLEREVYDIEMLDNSIDIILSFRFILKIFWHLPMQYRDIYFRY